MNVLILAGYKPNSHLRNLSQQTPDSPIFLDQQIKAALELQLSPIVVLSGSEADQVIRKSQNLEHCELIFDTHDETEVSLMTNLKAGVLGISETAFVLPVDIPCPHKALWVALKRVFQETGFSTKYAAIQLVDNQGAPWHWGFPLYLTRLGKHLLLNEPLSSLLDSQFTYFHSVFEPTEGLAPQDHNL